MAPVFVVPAVATTATASFPAARSARITRSSSSGRIPVVPVGGHHPDRGRAEAEDLGRLGDAAVALGAAQSARRPASPASPSRRSSAPARAAARCRATVSAVSVAADPPLTSWPEYPAGQPSSPANQRMTWCSRCTAAWLPPATLGSIAAASASASTPSGCGGELTQAAKPGCPLPKGYGATCAANSASTAPAGWPCSSHSAARMASTSPRGSGW